MGIIRQNYIVIDVINFRAEAKRFTHKMMHKITSCKFLDDAKKYDHVICPGVNSAYDTFSTVDNKLQMNQLKAQKNLLSVQFNPILMDLMLISSRSVLLFVTNRMQIKEFLQ